MGPWLLHYYYPGIGKVLIVILVSSCENWTRVRSHASADQHRVLEVGHTLTWLACLCKRISFPPGEGSLQHIMYLSVDSLLKLVLKTAYTFVRCDCVCKVGRGDSIPPFQISGSEDRTLNHSSFACYPKSSMPDWSSGLIAYVLNIKNTEIDV